MFEGRKISALLISVLVIFFAAQVLAQEGGSRSIFSLGAGARALALGGTGVAFPMDPTTVYWNPAGLEHLSRKSLTVFYASLPEGTSYNFIGYVHPTLSFGTLGIGLLRIGTGGIVERDEKNVRLGEFSYEQDELLFSYAKRLFSSLTFGINVKVERQVLGSYSDNGVGADFGVLYQSSADNFFLRGTSFGVNVINLVAPRLKPGETTDVIPYNIKFGVARSFNLGNDQHPLTFLLDVDKGEKTATEIHFGSEYSYRGRAMLRAGMNSQGMTFGAGAAYGAFQLDYSYGRMAEGDFSGSHRLSLTVHFGKTISELRRLAEERRQREIEERVARESERLRQERITNYMEQGHQYFNNEDYFNALVRFSQVLELDKGNKEAERMIAETNTKIQELREKQLAEERKKALAEREKQQLLSFVNEHFSKGLKFLEDGNYSEAIAEWELVLQRQPNNSLAQEYLQKAKEELVNKIERLIKKADRLAKKGDYPEAIRVLDEVKVLNERDHDLQSRISKKIDAYENKLDFLDFYERGLSYYNAENFKAALAAFEKALRLEPSNEKIKKYYQDAKARVLAVDQKMTKEMEKKFFKAMDLYLEDRFEEAIAIWEELLKEQPYNKRILKSIDDARKKLKKRKARAPQK